MDRQPSKLPWQLLLAALVLAMVGALWWATESIDYEWRWNRVPQYFAYLGETVERSPVDGQVLAVEPSGELVRVAIAGLGGETLTLRVESDTLRVAAGEDIYEGDIVGSTHSWRVGPLSRGLWVTVWISFVSGVFGLLLGLVAGLSRVSRNPTLRGLAIIYVEVIRGTPLLVQIFIFYFFIGTVLSLDRIVAGIGALALFTGAYVAEIVRAGIQSIPRGQSEAARSLGMTAGQAMRYIILPQAFKRTLPPLAGQFISLVKDSSLVSVIAITDLTKSGREVITSTFATFEIWFTVAALYFLLTAMLSQLVLWMERRLARSD